MRETLQDALDQITSTRSSTDTRTRALQTVERCLAKALADEEDREGLDSFLALQYTFECNVPLRLLSWLCIATTQLDSLIKGPIDESHEHEVTTLVSQIVLSLCLLQGISLSHPSCKVYLGRRYPQEVLLDLLLASRHLPSSSSRDSENMCRRQGILEQPLTSLVLDTLLCILVDSSSALRVFEDVGGPQAVVRILKRAGTPREVRMKCLEFLYFYLLDETASGPETNGVDEDSPLSSPPTVPNSPVNRPSKPSVSSGTPPAHPASRYGSSTYAFSDSSDSGRSSRSASGSSTLSFSSTSSNASSSTAPSSVSSSPEKHTSFSKSPLRARSPEKPSYRPKTGHPRTPPHSPPLDPARSQFRFPAKPPQPKAMAMLKKEIDYVPMSPKKAQVAAILGRSPGHTPKSKSMSVVDSGITPKERVQTKSRLQSAGTVPNLSNYSYLSSSEDDSVLTPKAVPRIPKFLVTGNKRTTEEKKQLLGTMLGNVDALVEGVRKAGIWGLA
ncbi:hypothetical protein CC1G_14691 [Coprinopsis cinerea okayama7|uniref:Cell division control protein 14 n=1 Tax=Coprinopsis cinerea (strain Okayama-7 / 130 / ATCC MYA-4618 / FGSC 9003) TaxID=240176 RepID=D6RMK5_COPC7|nr:hypothetical protein CC1G_14691 [Coprinopsis cinerea okayama7\|eukprot:XP_002911262.1 hypothetical protein CC1G_14691 [Coprinopsis cinerea okayama7\